MKNYNNPTESKSTGIEWTERTWNPVTGCTKVSPGCKHCYADRMAKRLKAMRNWKYSNGFEVTCHSETLAEPDRWTKPQIVFVNSMSDLFHEDVSVEFIQKVFGTMNVVDRHQYQVLTKRPERALELAGELAWSENVWMGVSVENANYVHRIDLLRLIPAKVRWLSLEPLLGPLNHLDLTNIDWVVVGGESGPGARPMDPDWVRDIRDQCVAANVPFFFKQWGGTRKKKAGRELDGRTWEEMPLCIASQEEQASEEDSQYELAVVES